VRARGARDCVMTPSRHIVPHVIEDDTDRGEVSQLLLCVVIHAGTAVRKLRQCNA
jgi:hypothetical protein